MAKPPVEIVEDCANVGRPVGVAVLLLHPGPSLDNLVPGLVAVGVTDTFPSFTVPPLPTITPQLLQQARQGQPEPLTLAVRELLMRAVLARRVPVQDAEDIVQDKILKILSALLSGRAEGREDGYVWRCGETSAISYFRKQKRLPIPVDGDDFEGHQAPDDGRSKLEEEQELKTQAELLHEILEGKELPEVARTLLEQVYVHELSIDELARRELESHPAGRDGTPRTLGQARNTLDQRLTRARKKLAELFLARQPRGGQ